MSGVPETSSQDPPENRPEHRAGARPRLRVLVVDDEQPAMDEISFLLREDERICEVHSTGSPTEALRMLKELEVDAVFLDIQMPGLSGVELAQVLARFRTPPATVFVTAHDQHAVDAFELNAVDYVLKPVRRERLAEAVRRVLSTTRPEGTEEQVPVERGGVTDPAAVAGDEQAEPDDPDDVADDGRPHVPAELLAGVEHLTEHGVQAVEEDRGQGDVGEVRREAGLFRAPRPAREQAHEQRRRRDADERDGRDARERDGEEAVDELAAAVGVPFRLVIWGTSTALSTPPASNR